MALRDPNMIIRRSALCYFCNETIPEPLLQDHVKQCGLVLEPCPQKCAVWIQRRHREVHAAECPRMLKPRPAALIVSNPQRNQQNTTLVKSIPPMTDSPTGSVSSRLEKPTRDITESLSYLHQKVSSLRSSLNEEFSHRVKLMTDLELLQTKFKQSEEWNSKIMEIIAAFRKTLDTIIRENVEARTKTMNEFEKSYMKQEAFDDWKMELDMRVDALRSSIIQEENQRSHIEVVLNQQDTKLRQLKKLESDMDLVRQAILLEQTEREKASHIWNTELEEFKEYLQQENVMISAVWKDQLSEISSLKLNIEERVTATTELKAKHNILDFEIKSMKNIVNEDSDKLASVVKDLEIVKLSTAQMKQDLTDFEKSVNHHKYNSSIENTEGHLLWRIDNFESNMQKAKDEDVTMHSPVFSSHRHGYLLKVELNLNGIGKWRGRHMTICLQVVAGPYDPLLKWPCSLPAEIILKELVQDTEPKDIVKNIVAKRKVGDVLTSVEEKGGQHIFIPHASMKKGSYVKNDIMFIEVKIKHSELQLNEI